MLADSIDTNIIIHSILDEPGAQRERIMQFLNRPDATHFVFDIAISEAVYVLEKFYLQSRIEIANNLTLFFDQFNDCLKYNKAITKMILPFWVEHPSLSFNDCYLGFRAEFDSVEPLFTLDKKLAAQHPSAKLI